MFLLFFITENTHTMRRNTIVTHKYITNTHIRDLRVPTLFQHERGRCDGRTHKIH